MPPETLRAYRVPGGAAGTPWARLPYEAGSWELSAVWIRDTTGSPPGESDYESDYNRCNPNQYEPGRTYVMSRYGRAAGALALVFGLTGCGWAGADPPHAGRHPSPTASPSAKPRTAADGDGTAVLDFSRVG